MAFLCIDIGGTNTLFGVGNGSFEKVEQIKTVEFLDDIENTVETILKNAGYKRVENIAVAAAGPVDKQKGLFYPPNIDQEVVQIHKPLEKFADTTIINDCAAAILGEYHYGESAENLLYVTVSSGIGGAYMENGELVKGSNGNFAEIGHMKIGNELECGCGGTGHWEAYCSGENMPQMASKLHDLEINNAKQLFELQNTKAQKALDTFKEKMGIGTANLINLYNPDKIVFGGAVALNHFDEIKQAIQKYVENETVNEMPAITLSGLEENSVLHGLRASCNKKIKVKN